MIVAIIATVVPGAMSQSKSDGSVYGRFGLGERRSTPASQAMGMGVLGVALFSPAYLNVMNPAAFSDQVFTRFTAGIDFNGVKSTDVRNQSSISAGGNIGSIQFGFPLVRRKLGFAASYSPFWTFPKKVAPSMALSSSLIASLWRFS